MVVWGMYPLTPSPWVQKNDVLVLAQELESATDKAIRAQVKKFKKAHEDANVVLLPLLEIYKQWATDRYSLGFADASSQCYNNTESFRTQPSPLCSLPRATICQHPDDYLYWVGAAFFLLCFVQHGGMQFACHIP